MSQNHETDREQLKKIALGIAVTLTAIILMVNVARYEVNVMLEIATTEWQRSINQYIFGAFAFVTMIIIAVVSGLKDSGKQRWFWYGLPIAIILLVLEEFAGYHYFTRIGYDYSEKQKSVSLSKKSLEAVFEKLDVKNAVVISESNSDQAEQILALNNQAAFAEKRLIGCNKVDGWKKRTDCQHTYESALNTANRKLKSIADIQNESHQAHSEKMSELNALLKLRETAQQEDKRIIPLPVYSMVISNNETALSFQNGMNWFLATAIVVVNSGLFFLGMGLLSQTKLSGLKIPSPALQSNHQMNNAQPQSFRQQYNAGELSAWSGLFNRTQSQPQTTASAVNANGNIPTAFTASVTNANAMLRRGSHEFNAHDDVAPNATAVMTEEPEFIMNGVGFNTQRIPNPRYQRPTPVIVSPETAPRGVEIEFAEPDADVNAVEDNRVRVQLDAVNRVHTDANAVNVNANNGGGNGRGTASILDYSDLVDAVVWSNYLQNPKKDVGIIGQNRVQEFLGVGRPVAKRYIERLVEDKIIDENWKVIK